MDWNTILPTGPFDLASTMECGQAFRWRQVSTPEMGDHFEGVIFGNLVEPSRQTPRSCSLPNPIPHPRSDRSLKTTSASITISIRFTTN